MFKRGNPWKKTGLSACRVLAVACLSVMKKSLKSTLLKLGLCDNSSIRFWNSSSSSSISSSSLSGSSWSSLSLSVSEKLVGDDEDPFELLESSSSSPSSSLPLPLQLEPLRLQHLEGLGLGYMIWPLEWRSRNPWRIHIWIEVSAEHLRAGSGDAAPAARE